MTILGIETSCDETALALIETKESGEAFECRVIQSLVHSQAELHSAYGGVYPNLAKREHSKNLVPLLEKIVKDVKSRSTLAEHEFKEKIAALLPEMSETNPDLVQSIAAAEFLKQIPDIDAIAVTEGPGLEPTLWVGINCARVLAHLWNIPIIPVDHMEGHIIGSLLSSDAPYGTWQKLKELPLPSISLLISGGHTELVSIENGKPDNRTPFQYSIIGQTKDDAVGEAFDKTARILGLPYPGGPHISRLAHEAETENISAPVTLPRPMISSGDLNFSFSGLKTAVLYAVKKATEQDQFTDVFKKGLAREFEQAVTDTLDAKLRSAIEKIGAQSVIIGGGVSANHRLREQFKKTASEYGIHLFLPSPHISGDNALMIALAGALHGIPIEQRPLRAEGTKKLA